MSIYKEGKHWRADVYVHSKRIKMKKGFLTKKEAKNWHDRQMIIYKDLLIAGEACDEKNSFDTLLIKFEEIHLVRISPSTARRYRLDIQRRIAPYFKGCLLKNMTPLMIEGFKSNLLLTLSPKSVANCMGLFKTILHKASEWEMMNHNPSKNIKLEKQHRKPYTWWENKEDITKFLDHAKHDRYYLAYRLALDCGMRLGEIIGLSKKDINLSTCCIHIHRQWLEKEKQYGPPKHGKMRYIRFHKESDLFELLEQAVQDNPEDEIIFHATKGGRLGGRKLSAIYFQRMIEISGVPRIRFHDLRHTFASWYMIENDNIWDLKGLLGHSDIVTTQQYAHLSSKGAEVPNFNWKP